MCATFIAKREFSLASGKGTNESKIANNEAIPYINSCTAPDSKKIVAQASMAITKFANSPYKQDETLELREINQIKDSFINFQAGNDKRTEKVKNEIIGDLDNFEKNIRENHYNKLADFTRKQKMAQQEIAKLEEAKDKYIFDKLSKIQWPYDENYKELCNKITVLETQAEHYGQKADYYRTMRPVATKKDIHLFKMQLNEKYNEKTAQA